MPPIFSKVAALVAAAVLALPPGLCCGMATAESPAVGVSQAGKGGSCCQAPLPEQPIAPAQPVAGCCCGVKAVTKADSVSAPDGAAVAAVSIPLAFAPPAVEMPTAVSPALFSHGPPLRILLCVWRN